MIRVLASSLVLALLPVWPALAWEDASAAGVRPIAEVQEKAESGDYVVVEGQITETRPGMGNLVVGRIEDETGWVYVAVPQHVRRTVEEKPELWSWIRVAGRWDHQKLKEQDDAVWGIRAQKVELIDR
jgi:hypothetical protein